MKKVSILIVAIVIVAVAVVVAVAVDGNQALLTAPVGEPNMRQLPQWVYGWPGRLASCRTHSAGSPHRRIASELFRVPHIGSGDRHQHLRELATKAAPR